MRRMSSEMLALFAATLFSIPAFVTAAQAQAGARLTFAINPSTFRAGQPASAELSVCSTSISTLTLSTGDTFTFFVDSSVGTVASIGLPVSVESSSLSASDFSASLGAIQGQVIITYIGAGKSLVFGTASA